MTSVTLVGCVDEPAAEAEDRFHTDWSVGTSWTWVMDDLYEETQYVVAAPEGWDGDDRVWLMSPFGWQGQGNGWVHNVLRPLNGHGLDAYLPGTVERSEAFRTADVTLSCPSAFYWPEEDPVQDVFTVLSRAMRGEPLGVDEVWVAFEGQEPVEVPAGTFDAQVFTIDAVPLGEETRERAMRLWYSAQVGHFVQVDMFGGGSTDTWSLETFTTEGAVPSREPTILPWGTDVSGRALGQDPGEFRIRAVPAVPKDVSDGDSNVTLRAERRLVSIDREFRTIDHGFVNDTGLDPELWKLEWREDPFRAEEVVLGSGPNLTLDMGVGGSMDIRLYAIPVEGVDRSCVEAYGEDGPDEEPLDLFRLETYWNQSFSDQVEPGAASGVTLGTVPVAEGGAFVKVLLLLTPDSAEAPDQGVLELRGPDGTVEQVAAGPEPTEAAKRVDAGGTWELVWRPSGQNAPGGTAAPVLTGHTVDVDVAVTY